MEAFLHHFIFPAAVIAGGTQKPAAGARRASGQPADTATALLQCVKRTLQRTAADLTPRYFIHSNGLRVE